MIIKLKGASPLIQLKMDEDDYKQWGASQLQSYFSYTSWDRMILKNEGRLSYSPAIFASKMLASQPATSQSASQPKSQPDKKCITDMIIVILAQVVYRKYDYSWDVLHFYRHPSPRCIYKVLL